MANGRMDLAAWLCLATWVGAILISLAVYACAGYIIWHFISKFW